MLLSSWLVISKRFQVSSRAHSMSLITNNLCWHMFFIMWKSVRCRLLSFCCFERIKFVKPLYMVRACITSYFGLWVSVLVTVELYLAAFYLSVTVTSLIYLLLKSFMFWSICYDPCNNFTTTELESPNFMHYMHM